MSSGADFDKGMGDGVKVAIAMGKSLNECKGAAPADIIALNKWFMSKAGSKQAMVDAASANSHTHAQEIQQHVEEVWETFFKFNAPKKTGISLGKTAYWALGPVDPNVIM